MKKTVILFTTITLLSGVSTGLLQAGTQDDAIAYYDHFYSEALRNLRFGNVHEKLEAATIIGGNRKASLVRPLGEELNKNLKDPALRSTPTNDPFVKSRIAWAIGQIGHRKGLPYLLSAITTTMEIIDEDIAAIEKKQAQNEKLGSPGYVGNMNKPGPFLMESKERDIYPASPDVFWSQADRFKSIPAIQLKAEDHYVLYKGYNSINMAQSILSAIGNIGKENGLYYRGLTVQKPDQDQLDEMFDTIAVAIDHPLPGVRMGAISALEGLGIQRAVAMLTERFDKETDPVVKVRVAGAVLMNDKSQYRLYRHLLKELTSNNFDIRREAILALYDIQMGESVFALRDALAIESNPVLVQVLKEAILRAEMDNQVPLNY